MALYTFKTHSNAMKYCDYSGPTLQNRRLAPIFCCAQVKGLKRLSLTRLNSEEEASPLRTLGVVPEAEGSSPGKV